MSYKNNTVLVPLTQEPMGSFCLTGSVWRVSSCPQLDFIAELRAAGSFLPAEREEHILIWYFSKDQ